MNRRFPRGLTLIELLVVMFIMTLIMAFIAVVLMNVGSEPRKKKALADIAKLSIALSEYKNRFGSYPPDTGYGFDPEGARPVVTKTIRGVDVQVPTFDPGGLWRYLCSRVRDPDTDELVGPFLEDWPQEQLLPYNDAYDGAGSPPSRYLADPWGKPYGFIGDKRRVLHNHGSFDIFSAGPDGVTACNNGEDDPLFGSQTGDGPIDCSNDPSASTMPKDNRAYNSQNLSGRWVGTDDDNNGVRNDSEEFGPEAIRNGDIGDDINNWSNK